MVIEESSRHSSVVEDYDTRSPRDPIPSVDSMIEERQTRSLDDLGAGDRLPALRADLGLGPRHAPLPRRAPDQPGARFEVIDRQPFGGPLEGRFDDGRVQMLGGDLTEAMRVEVDE
jgi:DtxR family transcriptional regulator, Mn-dependent transcriptional regulator